MRHIITLEDINNYERNLVLEERSTGTIQKYLRDVRTFYSYLPASKAFDKESVIAYKEYLNQKFAVSTANSMLAAINSLFSFLGWYECRVKPFKQQRRIFRDKNRELSKTEYLKLLDAAKEKGNRRLFYLMQTLCATGVRISELRFITAESVRSGKAEVDCKGKVRTVLLTKKLRRALTEYCKKCAISSGPVFVTKTGRAMNRSNVWTEMKRLCDSAGVDAQNVFPNNLRHLFAISF